MLGVLGEYVADENLNSQEVSSLLKTQKKDIADAVPADLNLGVLLDSWPNKSIRHSYTTPDSAKNISIKINGANKKPLGKLKKLFSFLGCTIIVAAFWYVFLKK